MSMLKQVDGKTGELKDAPTTDAKHAFHEAMQRVEDAFTVALKAADDRAAQLEASITALRKEHDDLQKAHADAQAKLSVLSELKAKLANL